MDPQSQSCHNPDGTARGQLGLAHIRVHGRKGRRYRCTTCGRTRAAARDTPSDRLKRSADPVTLGITLLGHGCPAPAIVAAFGLDERAVADRRDRAGRHARRSHDPRVVRGPVAWGHVQADEPSVKAVARRLRMAMAMAVPSRLRPGAVVSERRDLPLILAVVGPARRAAEGPSVLVGVDGRASDVPAFTRVSRDPARARRRGRPRRAATPGRLPGQVIERHGGRRRVDVTRRVVRGTAGAIAGVLSATGAGTGIDTPDLERLDATSRGARGPRVRRGRAIARGEAVLTGRMDRVGCADDSCWEHDRLRSAAWPGGRLKWPVRTPAMVAGPTDHRWTMRELLSDPIRSPPWVAPKRRGRPPKRIQAPVAVPA